MGTRGAAGPPCPDVSEKPKRRVARPASAMSEKSSGGCPVRACN